MTTSRLLAGASCYSFKEGKLRGVARRLSDLFPFCVPEPFAIHLRIANFVKRGF